MSSRLKRDLRFEFSYPHPIERVYTALTDPAALAEWLMANDFAPRVGHTFHFRADPQLGWNGIVECEVIEVEPPRRLAYTWRGGGMRQPTVVRFELEPVMDGTRLVLTHTGFAGAAGLAISTILGRGWRSKILAKMLPRVLDRLAEADRPATTA